MTTTLGTRPEHGTIQVAEWALHATAKTGKGRGNNGFKYRTACGRGHEYVEGSWNWQKKGGHKTRRCLVCKRDRMVALKGDPVWLADKRERTRVEGVIRRAAARLGITAAEYRETMGDAIAKKNPLDIFIITGEEAAAQDRVNAAVDLRGKPKCIDYPEAYFSDETISNKEAQKLCAGCPIVVECLERMKFSPPSTGSMVAGGRVFVDGKLRAK